MIDTFDADVLAAERRRCDAMLANDARALDAILDDALHFSHANGAVDDKPAYLAKMATGRITYLSIDWSEARVIPLSEHSALLTGRMSSSVQVEGVDRRLENRVISAWLGGETGWRMIAFQSTPLPTTAP